MYPSLPLQITQFELFEQILCVDPRMMLIELLLALLSTLVQENLFPSWMMFQIAGDIVNHPIQA